MVTTPEFEGSFLPLLRCIQDKSVPDDDRVDAYLRFTERLREEQDTFVIEVCSYIKDLTAVFQNDMINPETELCQASLQALGHCLYQQQIARTFSESDGKDLLQGLTKVISTTEEKGICTRALWCIAKQNLPQDIVSDQLSVMLSSIECALNKNLQSTTVDNEVICVVDRLLQQLPDSVMIKSTAHWSKLVIPLTVSTAGKVREYSLAIVASHLSKIISAREEVLPWLLPILKSGFIGELSKLCSEKKELFVLRVWSCIVPVLGKALHKSSLINDILKLVEQGFKNPSVSVQVESYFAWQVLIDNFSTNQDVLSAPKRINLIMMPLLKSAVKECNEKVEAARLSTWWHFVCAFESKRLLDFFDKICIPLLQFIFGTSIDKVSLLKSKEGFGDLNCPPTPTNGKFLTNSLFETPKATARRSLKDVGTPKTPTIINASFAKETKDKLLIQGCEILERLLSVDGSSTGNVKFTLEQSLQAPVIQTKEAFEKHSSVLISSVREAFKACGRDLEDSLLMSIWNHLVMHVENVFLNESLERNRVFESHFLPVLATAEELTEGNFVSRTTFLKMLERVSKLSPRLISHHISSLQSEGNPHGTASVVVLHLLLSPVLFKDGQNNERFFLAFENLLSCGIDTTAGQLVHIQAVLQLLQSLASFSEKKHPLWRLWSSTVSKLNENIIKNNEVNQGNALEHDFTAVYLAFLLPSKELLNSSLGQGEIKSINKELNELYRGFSRAAALLPSVDTNTCAEELCVQLLDNWSSIKAQDISFLTGMVNLVTTILECMDYTVTSIFAGKSPIKSPSKWTKQLARPLDNMTSTVELMRRLLTACSNMIDSKKMSNNSGMLAALLTNLIDSLSMFYQHLNGAPVIAAAVESLFIALVPIVRSSHTSIKEPKSCVGKVIFTMKFIQKVEKLWQDILTSIQSRHGGLYSSELLAIMSPLLEVTFVHHRRHTRNKTLIFWNATFANSQLLKYPDSLRPVLLSMKDKGNLTLPGLTCTEEDPLKETQQESENEEMSQITQPQGSPIRAKPLMFFGTSPKVRGSFLHKAVQAEKAVENKSPKRAWTEPRLPSMGKVVTRNTHARRKLPLSLLDDDSQDFVRIASSPTKKRLLTEHQKEVMREKSTVPVLYNCLDQSQDAFYATQEPSMCTPSPIEEQPAPFENKISVGIENKKEDENQNNENSITEVKESSSDGNREATEKLCIVSEIPESMETDMEDPLPAATSDSVRETPVKCQPMTSSSFSPSHMEDATSPDIIPSSQVTSDSPRQFKSLRRSGRIPVNSIVVLLKDVNEREKTLKPSTIKIEPEDQSQVEPTSTSRMEPVKERTKVNSTSTSNLEPVKAERPEVKPTSVTIDEEESVDEKRSLSQENDAKVDLPGEVSSTKKKNKPKIKKSKTTSPISGRTRKGRQVKSETPKVVVSEIVDNDTEETSESSSETRESSEGTRSGDSLEQHNSRSCDKHLDSEEQTCEAGWSKKQESDQTKAEETVDVKSEDFNQCLFSKDAMSSPVSRAKIKFMKPSTGSPTPHSSIKGFQSPVSSPTTGILKRYTGRYDSPSPPNKVRRVSFAMPLAQEAQQKDLSVNPSAVKSRVTLTDQTDLSLKEPESAMTTPSRGADHFTIIKRRRKTPSGGKEGRKETSKEGKDGNTLCIYPDLVDCNVPVEQILPSLCSFTWSRGLGHVVHAQNIRTVGNLSSLKEHQIRNLPIRSPKVQTLRAALTSFHQKTKGLKSKSARDIAALGGKERKLFLSDRTIDTNCPTILEADDAVSNNEVNVVNKQEQLPTITDEMMGNSNELSGKSESSSENCSSVEQLLGSDENYQIENNVLSKEEEPEEKNECVEDGGQKETSKDDASCILKDQTVCAVSDEQEPMELSEEVSETLENAGHSGEKSYTPPLPTPDECSVDSNTLDEQDNSSTPTRTARTKPVVLFTPPDGESEDIQAYSSTELMNRIDEDLEKDYRVSNTEEDSVAKIIRQDGDNRTTDEEIDEQTPVDADIDDVETKDNRTTENEEKVQTAEESSEDKPPEDKPSEVDNSEEASPKQTFYHSLNSILETATPEVLARLSNQETFLAHKNLTELMSRVVTALQEKLQGPCQEHE